jgi:hypothetical protein
MRLVVPELLVKVVKYKFISYTYTGLHAQKKFVNLRRFDMGSKKRPKLPIDVPTRYKLTGPYEGHRIISPLVFELTDVRNSLNFYTNMV